MNIKELVKKAVGINIGSFRESVNKANTNILNKKVYVKPEIDLSPVDVVFNERLNAIEEEGGAGGGTSFGGDIESLSEAAKTAKEGEMFRLTKDDVFFSKEYKTFEKGTYKTPSNSEMKYLLYYRTEEGKRLWAIGKVGEKQGLFLFPLNFKHIDNFKQNPTSPCEYQGFKFTSEDTRLEEEIHNTLTKEQFEEYEKDGLIFIPSSSNACLGWYYDPVTRIFDQNKIWYSYSKDSPAHGDGRTRAIANFKECEGMVFVIESTCGNGNFNVLSYVPLYRYVVPTDDFDHDATLIVRLIKDVDENEKIKFPVGENKYCQFSSGNLQYNLNERVWRFAPNQYDVVSTEDKIKLIYDIEKQKATIDWIDIFRFGETGATSDVYTRGYNNRDVVVGEIQNTVHDWGTYCEISGNDFLFKEFKAGSLVVYKDGQFEPMVEPQENDNQCYLNDYVNTDEKLNFNVIKMPAINGNNFTLIIDEKDVDQTTKLIILDGNKKEEINLIDKYDFDAGFYVIEKLYPFTPKFYIEKNGVKSPMLTPVGIAMNMGMNNTYNITKSNGYIGPKYDTLILERAYRVGTQDFISVINNNFYGINFIDFEPVKRTIGYNVYANSNKLLGYTYHMVNGTTCDIEDKHTYIGDMVHFKYIPRASYNLDYIEFENEKIELREDNDYYVKKTLIISTIYIVETAIV